MGASTSRRKFLASAGALAGGAIRASAAPDAGLVGYWKLAGDAKDSSGHGNHGTNHGVVFAAAGTPPRIAARLNGRDRWIEVPHNASLAFGASDFSVAVWVNTEQALGDVVGDIACKYDPGSRRGFSFCIKTNSVTTSQSNDRNVHFGIDSGRLDQWVDCGRPGEAVFVMGLCVHDGQLYAATCESGKERTGHVFQYAGGARWTDCGSPDPSDSISALAAWDGRLYAASARYNLGGSSLAASPNEQPGGKVYRYEGGSRWADCGKIGDSAAVASLAVFRGKLYASSMYAPAGTFRYDGGQTWTPCGTPEGRRVEALAVFNDSLFGTGYDKGEVYRYDGNKWSIVGALPGATQTYGFGVYEGNLYVSTWPNASVFRYDGDHRWRHCGRLGNELEVMGLAVYNGKMYAGTLPLAEVHRYEGGTNWIRTGQLDKTPNVRYRRAWSMAVFQGKLFCGTLPSGHVYSLQAGRSATHDHVLGPGWKHLAAVRRGGALALYVDGREAASSPAFSPSDYDISNSAPLRIGFGGHDYFNGSLSDLRIYNRALAASDIRALSRKRS